MNISLSKQWERIAPYIVILGIAAMAVLLPGLYANKVESAKAVAFTSTSTVFSNLDINENARMIYASSTYYIVYTSTTDSFPKLFITHSTDDGANWSAPSLIESELVALNATSSYFSDFSLDYSEFGDFLAVTYKDNAGYENIYATSDNDGATWTTSSFGGVFSDCTGGNANEVAIGFATSSAFTAALCSGGNGIFEMVTSSDGGVSWSATTTVYDGSATYDQSREGAVHVHGGVGSETVAVMMLLADDAVGSEIVYAESVDGGNSFTTTSVVTIPTIGGLFASNSGLTYGFDSDGLAAFLGQTFNDASFNPPILSITTTLLYGKRAENGTWSTTTVGSPLALDIDISGVQPAKNQFDLLFFNNNSPIVTGVGVDPDYNPLVYVNTSTFISTTVSDDESSYSPHQIAYNAAGSELAYLYISDAGNMVFATSSLVDPSLQSFGGGVGTEGSPYQITSCAHLQEMDDNGGYASSYYELTTDLTCNDIVPIAREMDGGSTTTFDATFPGFAGSIDGGGYTVTYTVSSTITEEGYVGLFGYLNGATITDLTIAGSVTGTHAVGGLAAFSSSTVLTNVTSTVDVMGRNISENLDIDYVGGLFGYAEKSISLTNIYVSGDVTVTGTVDMSNIAGVVGDITNVSSTTVIDTIHMAGDVSAYSTTTSTIQKVAGLFGDYDTDNIDSNFVGLSMFGDVTVETLGEVEYVAGLIADLDINSYGVTTTDSIASGDIYITATSSDYVGGFFAAPDGNSLYIIDSTSTVDMFITVSSSVNYIGGFVGDNDMYTLFQDAIYDGSMTIDAGSYIYDIGGFVGHMTDDIECNNCVSEGTITLTVDVGDGDDAVESVGGIIGFLDEYEGLFYGVTSTVDINIDIAGDVAEGAIGIGGIIGQFDGDDEDEDIYASSTVYAGDITITITATSTESYGIAGFIGYMYEPDDIECSDCSVAGNITFVGNVISTDVYGVGGYLGYTEDYGTFTFEDSVSTMDFDINANTSSTEVYGIGGMFGYLEDVDLTINRNYYDGTIAISGGDETYDIGGFIGYFYDEELNANENYAIVNILVTSTLDTYSNLERIGGFIGTYEPEEDSTIENAFVSGGINVTTEGETIEDTIERIGGFIGNVSANQNQITNTYADVGIDITSNDTPERIGSFIGSDFTGLSEITNSFATGRVYVVTDTESDLMGGFYGYYGGATSTGNYFDMARTSQDYCNNTTTTISGCTGVNDEHEDSDYFIGNDDNAPMSSWDFDDVWQIDEDYYPVLAFNIFEEGYAPLIEPEPTTGGGGGGYVAPSKPKVSQSSNMQIDSYDVNGVAVSGVFSINSGEANTDDTSVTLNFTDIVNASSVAFSNTLDFSGVSYVPFDAQSFIHTLTEGNGIKTVYAKLRSSQGGTLIIKDTINLTGQDFDQAVETTPTSAGAASCPLSVQTAYKTPQSNAIYYVTKDCTKRGFSSADLYFTYFSSWSDVQLTTQTLLNSVPNDTIGFLPLGPRYAPTSGALVKTLFDAKTYLLLQGTLYHIEDEAAAEFQFGPTWATWIEGVDERLLQNYPLSTTKLNTTDRLDGMLIKYPNDAKVYQLATEDGVQVKRWIPTEAAFAALNFRDDRIVTIPTSESYPDGTDLTS